MLFCDQESSGLPAELEQTILRSSCSSLGVQSMQEIIRKVLHYGLKKLSRRDDRYSRSSAR